MTVVDVGLMVTLVVLVVVLFILAMIEASLLHVRRSAVAASAKEGDDSSRRLLALLDDLPRVMNTVLLAVLLAQVTSTAIAGVLAQRWIGESGITAAALGVTVILFVYGEAIPKTIAINDPIRHAMRFTRFVRLLTVTAGPVVSVLVAIAKWQSPDTDSTASVSAVSEDELLHITGEAAAAGQIELSDAELIEKSFTIGDLQVGEIVIPLEDVVSVVASAPVGAALRTAIGAGHRRLVVYDVSPDRVVGFVRLRDLANAVSTNDGAIVASQVRPALSVDASALVIDVLHQMQRARCHLAVVTTAEGATMGIVTVEDIVEELLGDIDDTEWATT